MKKLMIIALVILANRAFAQKDTIGLNVPFINNTIAYESVFDAPNSTQNLLYSNASLWLAQTHPYGGVSQLTLADPTISRTVGKVTYSTTESNKVLWQTTYYKYTYNFTVQIDCKDNKYRIRIYNIQHVKGSVYTPIDEMMKSLINSKSYSIASGDLFSKNDLKDCLKEMNITINNLMAEISKSITEDNSF